MLINTFYFYGITVLSLCSFIGFGFILNNLFLIKKTNNQNIFNYFFLGLVFIIPLSFFNYLLIGNFFLINILIFITGLFFFFKNAKLVDFKINLLIVFLFFTGLLISKTHEDFSVYHFQHIKELSDGSLIFGLANLDSRYFYASIYSYVQSIYKFNYFDLNLINIPIYLIYLSLVGYLFIEISKKRKIYICSFMISLIIFKFKRLSEFGYDYIGQFILLYIFIEYIINKENNSSNKNTELLLIYFTSILIKITNIYFLPIILFYFILKKKLNNLFNYKKLIFVSLILVFTFSANSFLKTGCLNYFVKKSCISNQKNPWVFEYSNIENSKKISKNWSRGFYHQNIIKYSEKEYNKNFNWLNNWFSQHFIKKILPFIFILVSILLIQKFFVFNKSVKNKKNLFFLVGSIISLLLWLINFPQFRFGFAGIIILFLTASEIFFGLSKGVNLRRFYTILIIGVIYFNLHNISRISSEFNREDIYKFSNFPWFSLPELKFTTHSINNFIYFRSAKNKNFWRTCFNAKQICVNHDEEVNFNSEGRLLFISKL